VLLGCIAILAISGITQARLEGAALDAARRASAVAEAQGGKAERVVSFADRSWAGWAVGYGVGMVVLVIIAAIPIGRLSTRMILAMAAVLIAAPCIAMRWDRPLERFGYVNDEIAGRTQATYTIIPWSPTQRFSSLDRQPPGTEFKQAMSIPAEAPGGANVGGRRFILGTDAFGSDVLSQLMHASRLAISIGLVATGVALVIGVTMGALMGFFGGWVDLILYRVVEIFMAVPVLFLLIVAVAVLPEELRTTYVMMAIIGCFTWTGMARFTRAEFMKLRNQDFVQAAQATGLPLWSVLFRHMLPNGIAPVLVDTSFAVAAVIGLEATLSYLGLGPVDSPSWGRLLSSAISSEGQFKWWLAVFPGLAIFMTVLSYNLLGEALRDAIDPKLKKARV
jgi:ABC-type dipeptide/oligopeptide/nickel transport system permease subunit